MSLAAVPWSTPLTKNRNSLFQLTITPTVSPSDNWSKSENKYKKKP
jgi:hypothetical protein